MNVGFKIPAKLDSEPRDRTLDLREYLNFVWRHWMLIASVTALGFVVGVAYLVRAIPLYTATTQILLEQREKAPGLDGINRLRGALAVSRGGQAQILNIAITWVDPVRAAQLANAVADAYVVDQLDARLESAKRASGWLSDRLVELRKQLSDAEEAVASFRKAHGLTRSGPTVALNDQQLADLNSKLVAARTEVAERKARVNFLSDLAAGKKTLDSLPDSLL